MHYRYLYVFSLLLIYLNCVAQPSEKQPNIIIIFADDMGYGDVSSLNPEAKTFTPHIDDLAQQSLLFTNAHASASVCTPSRYGILTGRYAWRSEAAAGVCNGFTKPVIEYGRETLGSLLKNAGYTTACIGKWHLGVDWQTKDGTDTARFDASTGYSNVDYSAKAKHGPNDFGFDYSFIQPASLDMPPYVFLRNHQAIDPDVVLTADLYPDHLPDTEYAWDKKHTGENDVYWDKGVWWRRGEISKSYRIENCLPEIIKDGVSFIENHVQQQPEKPFFLYLPITGPHTPWMPTDQFKGKSTVGTYGDFMLNVDQVVGEITRTLRQLDVEENTIIIFSSDNGAYWPQSEIDHYHHDSNWGTRGQKGDIWDGGHRMPLIISWPAQIKKQMVYNQLVSLTDIYATLADLTKQKVSTGSGEDSFSFYPVLMGNMNVVTRKSMIHQSSGRMFAIRMDGWKLIDGLGSGGFTAPSHLDPQPGEPTGQLYQMETDSLEMTNVFLEYPEIREKLQQELNETIKQDDSHQ